VFSLSLSVWQVPLADGSLGLLAVNWNKLIPVSGKVELKGKYKIRDIIEHKDMGEMADVLSIGSIKGHRIRAFKLIPIN